MTQPKIRLFDYGLAYYPARTRLMFMEKGFKEGLVHVDILKAENLAVDFMSKSGGTGTLPFLEILDDQGHIVKTLGQSSLIAKWLDEFDGKRLGSEAIDVKFDDVDQVLKEFEAWNGNVYSEGFSPVETKSVRDYLGSYRLAYAEARLKDAPENLHNAYEAKIAAMKLKGTERDYSECAQQLRTILDKSEQRLASSPFLCGSAFTAADSLLTTIVWRVKQTGKSKDEIDSRPNLSKWWEERIKVRPSFDLSFARYPYQSMPIFAVAGLLPRFLWHKITGRV